MDCRGAVVLGESDAKLADTQVALAAAKAQLAAHDKHLASQDATIKSLLRKQASSVAITTTLKLHWATDSKSYCLQGQHEGLAASVLKSLHTRFKIPVKNDKALSADMDDGGANDAKAAS